MGWRLKRLFRRPMNEGDVYEIIDHLLINYDWLPPEWQTLTIEKNSAGETYIEHWKKNLQKVIQLITDEPTWRLQREKMLRLNINALSWISVWNAISKYENEPILWANLVENDEYFKLNNDRTFWYSMIGRESLINDLNLFVFATIQKWLFAISDEDVALTKFWQNMKEQSLAQRLSTKKQIYKVIECSPDLGNELYRLCEEKHFPYWQKEYLLLQNLAEDIIKENNIDHYAKMWEQNANESNAALKEIWKILHED